MLAVPARRFLSVASCIAVLLLAGCASAPLSAEVGTESWDYDRVESLPEQGTMGDARLADALAQRRSVRAFAPDPITVEQAADLLWAAQGMTAEWGGRTAPSAGALYPLEVYLVTADGIQHYLSDGHQVQVRDSSEALSDVAAAVGQDSALAAPALLVITGTPDRLQPKYLLRAERYTLMEAGHAAQNLLLAATALGLGGVSIGAFDAGAVARALGLPYGEDALYVIPIGVPASDR